MSSPVNRASYSCTRPISSSYEGSGWLCRDGPRADAAAARARRVVLVRLRVGDGLHGALDAHLQLQRLPEQAERRVRVRRQLARLAALQVGVEHEAAARRSPSAAPCARTAAPPRPPWPAPWPWAPPRRRPWRARIHSPKRLNGSPELRRAAIRSFHRRYCARRGDDLHGHGRRACSPTPSPGARLPPPGPGRW